MRRGLLDWRHGFRAAGLLVPLMAALFTGCDAPSVSHPQTAAEAGRAVYGAADSDRNPAGPRVPEPLTTELEPWRESSAKSQPVVATKPTDIQPVAATRPAPAAAESEQIKPAPAEPALTRAQMMARIESQGTFQPADDPSQYPGGIVPASLNAEPLPGGPRLLVPERNFRTEGNPPALRVNYDDLDLLKVLNMGSPIPISAVEMFPDWLKQLDGKRIRIRGFMIPQYTTRLTGFVLARDMGACCFGPNPRIYYLISVKLKEGTEVEYIAGRPFDVVGTFHINPLHDDQGNWFQLWSIDEAVVIE